MNHRYWITTKSATSAAILDKLPDEATAKDRARHFSNTWDADVKVWDTETATVTARFRQGAEA